MAESPSRTKINVIIPSIGQPHFETKLRILRSNLNLITADGRGNALEFFVQCFLYTPEPLFVSSLLAALQEYIPASNVVLHVEPGYLGSFIYRWLSDMLAFSFFVSPFQTSGRMIL